MRNFVVSMIIVFLVLCVPWFCVAHAEYGDSDWYEMQQLKAQQTRIEQQLKENNELLKQQNCTSEYMLMKREPYGGTCYEKKGFYREQCIKRNYDRCMRGY